MFHKTIKIFLGLMLVATVVTGQVRIESSASELSKVANEIKKYNLVNYLTTLAADDMEGRETGRNGNNKAALYLANKLQSFGVTTKTPDNLYFQPIRFYQQKWKNINLNVAGKDLKHLWDYYVIPDYSHNMPTFSADGIKYLGYGIDDEKYSNYDGVDPGSLIMIHAGEPTDGNGKSLLGKDGKPSEWGQGMEKKLEAAMKHRVRVILVIDDKFSQRIGRIRKWLNSDRIISKVRPYGNNPSVMFISPETAKKIAGDKMGDIVNAVKMSKELNPTKPIMIKKPVNINLHKTTHAVYSQNVIGFIEGSDPVLKNEVVVLSAHYDHVGFRGKEVYNGADDDGSGTTAVLELMRVFSKLKKEGMGAKRSIMSVHFTGEEKGLLGSAYFTDNPTVPLENMVTDLNMDMVGRVDKKHEGNPNYIYLIGADKISQELHDISETLNTRGERLELDYTYNDENDPNRFYYRSDHYNFAKHGIPIIFYFNGTHEDYHQPGDTVDKIHFDKMTKITRLVGQTAWEIANRKQRLKITNK